MNKKTILTSIALITVLALALAGCGSKAPQETAAAQAEVQPLGLSSWIMNATTWSSPNGATVNLTAIPNGYAEGQSAAFCVRLEGEEIENIPCNWDGTSYTASAELNAADGYCYYVILTDTDGTQLEIPVNTPTNPVDDSLINMETSLKSYCSLTVNASELDGNTLTITDGTAQIQLPSITRAEGTVSCTQALLILSFNGEDVTLEKLVLPEADASGSCMINLAGVSFDIPDMEDDQQLSLRLEASLSNDMALTAPGGTWFYLNGELLLAVG